MSYDMISMVDLARPCKRKLSTFTVPNGLARSHSQEYTEQLGTFAARHPATAIKKCDQGIDPGSLVPLSGTLPTQPGHHT